MAKCYGVGVGPGDPELVTAKAIRLMQDADIVICPEKKTGSGSVAFEIAKTYLRDRMDCVRFMVFPMTGSKEEWEASWKGNADVMIDAWESGKDIVFLTLGDPSIYSTWSHLQPYLPKEMEREVVPGVPSFCAVAARVGTHLTLGDENLAVLNNADHGTLKAVEKWADTMVVMKPCRSVEVLRDWLEVNHLENYWSLVSECGKENEQILEGDINQLSQGLSYFSTMLIKKGDGK